MSIEMDVVQRSVVEGKRWCCWWLLEVEEGGCCLDKQRESKEKEGRLKKGSLASPAGQIAV